MENKYSKFTWVPFYEELARKLLEYKDHREELVRIIDSLKTVILKTTKDTAVRYLGEIDDIDPFSFFAIFNSLDDNSKESKTLILEKIKLSMSLKSEIPSNFDGIPVLRRNGRAKFYNTDKKTNGEDISLLWSLFGIAMDINGRKSDFSNCFDKCIELTGYDVGKFATGLFWVNPKNFIPLDINTRSYLTNIKNDFSYETITGGTYLELIHLVKNKIDSNEIKEKSFVELSYNAWKAANDQDQSTTSEGDSKMNKAKELADILSKTKNLILHGAPGTGKTYLANQIAQQMIFGKVKNDDELTKDEKRKLQEQVGFVQFHPSYDYTDFVEGLRPINDENNNQIGFKREDGIFKKFCEKALKNLVERSKDDVQIEKDEIFDTVYSSLLDDIDVGDISEYETAKGAEKHEVYLSPSRQIRFKQNSTHEKTVREDYLRILFNLLKDTEVEKISMMTRDDVDKLIAKSTEIKHVDYIQYRWTVAKLVEKFKSKEFSFKKRGREEAKDYIFIIDEINRGDMSKIFGELFFAIEPNYRGPEKCKNLRTQYANLQTEENEFDKVLEVTDFGNYGHFFIPKNVYIIGTMNDIDRSVDSMDFAFRRRFTFKEIEAKETVGMLDDIENIEVRTKAMAKMQSLNNAIWDNKKNTGIEGLSSSYHIGGAYFLNLNDLDGDFDKLWQYHLEPLLKEYLRGMEDADNILKDKLKPAYDSPKNDSSE